ncbi:hypothetical protein HXX76_012990 [Chlamydomonas incerta]|uniref:Uncharacterized protein n=1 Tax=Chlamydomonas incerta TaxID=51695 RepID=A0A835SU65_CHLIN|nr:hypothetical protein HXX76_012990 [Chlamydomonas incerta]|eukprot:KAG2426680.1 hypothetical protein HXX76_012990 [Chlamydomonas incerta]
MPFVSTLGGRESGGGSKAVKAGAVDAGAGGGSKAPRGVPAQQQRTTSSRCCRVAFGRQRRLKLQQRAACVAAWRCSAALSELWAATSEPALEGSRRRRSSSSSCCPFMSGQGTSGVSRVGWQSRTRAQEATRVPAGAAPLAWPARLCGSRCDSRQQQQHPFV